MTSEGKQSPVEAVTSVAVGFLLALLMQIAIFPVFGLVVSVADNRLIGTILTIVPSRLVSRHDSKPSARTNRFAPDRPLPL